MNELSAIVKAGPDPAVDGVVRWRRGDLKRVIEARFGAVYSERSISEFLAVLGFSRMSTRPQHPKQDERVIPAALESNLLAGIVREQRTGAYAPRPRRPERSEE